MSSIVRVKKDSNYVVMNKISLQDKSLSWKAKGIMAYMLSMPDDWVFHKNELRKHSTDGKDSFESGFKELVDQGYVKRIRTRNEKGVFDWETVVYEKPQPDYPVVDKPVPDNPVLDNPQLLSIDELSIDELSNNNKIPYVEIVNYLNGATAKNFKATTAKTKSLIKARMSEGFTVDDFKRVIDNKASQWLNDPKDDKYLRPETLFGNKFESYLNERGGFRNGRNAINGANHEQPGNKKTYADGVNF